MLARETDVTGPVAIAPDCFGVLKHNFENVARAIRTRDQDAKRARRNRRVIFIQVRSFLVRHWKRLSDSGRQSFGGGTPKVPGGQSNSARNVCYHLHSVANTASKGARSIFSERLRFC